MEKKIKCFTEEHKEIDAISYCPECRVHMCNKCENLHSALLKTHHHPYKLNKEEELFTGYCKEKDHPNKLEFFCKTHNQLCCGLCIAKLNEKGIGQHKDCEVCIIEKIKEEKKNKLKENIKNLEDLQNKFNDDIDKLKEIFEKIEKDKDDLKLKIQNIFTKIRTTLNEREDQLFKEIDNMYNDKFFSEDIIKKGEKLPKQIKISLEKGKLIYKEWDNINLYSYINDCINIEHNIKNINIINKSINKFRIGNKIKIGFEPKEAEFNNFLETLNSFGKIYYIDLNCYKFKECPENIKETRAYSLSGENNNVLTKTGTDRSNMGTICENELDKSIEEYKWKIKILKTKDKQIMVGVAPSDFDINSSNFDTCGYYLFCHNSTLSSGPPFNYSSKKTNLTEVKDEIVIIMNMKKRTLKFIINSEDKGDSYTNIPIDKPLFPAIILYHKDDSVEITDC